MSVAAAVAPLLRFEGVTKRFGGVTALDGVDFDLHSGEIHALLGENGAGKSTLIKLLAGIHAPDGGTIAIDGRPIRIDSVATSNCLGIRVIHQELSLAPNLSIAANISLGREPVRGGWLCRGEMERRAAELVRALGLDEIHAVQTLVANLSVAQQQLVEIARALSCQARILVLDEPTSALSEAETEALFRTLRRLRGQGTGLIYISHRLEEILRLADRITVLRDGRTIGTQSAGRMQPRELVRWMIGRDLADYFHRPAPQTGPLAFAARDLSGPKVNGVSFALHYGEILGIAGLVGSGRSSLARTLFGITPMIGGRLEIDGTPVTIRSPEDALAAGIALVPEDRKEQGLILGQSVAFNLTLPWAAEWIKGCFPHYSRRAAIIDRAVRTLRIRVTDPEQPVATLSGGNQQKVVLGRWLERPPKILILDEPTRGIDVGARAELIDLLGTLIAAGMAVLLISSDLAELVGVAHRIALYENGRIVRTVLAAAATPQELLEELTGANRDARA